MAAGIKTLQAGDIEMTTDSRTKEVVKTGTFAAAIGSILTAVGLWFAGSKPEAAQLASTALMAIFLRRGMIK